MARESRKSNSPYFELQTVATRWGESRTKQEKVLEQRINRLKQEEAITEKEHQAAQATQVDVHDVRFRRLEAEIWLNEEKAR